MNMREALTQWINEKDLPEMLRMIEALCGERFEQGCAYLSKTLGESGRSRHDDYTPEERRASDLAAAYLCVRASYIAAEFEALVRHAGLTIAERHEIRELEEIQRLEAELERKKKYARRANG